MGTIHKSNIGEICKSYNQICGANKNLYRTIPSMIDGLKPGARRLMYTLYKYYSRKEMNKVAEIGGRVLGLHPHGDTSVVDTLVALGQPFSNNACLITGKGNFGSLMGTDHAAGRYIEARMSDYAWKCFFEDYEDSIVDEKLSFNAKTHEPIVLPARYPHALFNGVLGIGYGLSSNIPPYNVSEVMNATIALIKDPSYKPVLIPDSPTGCYVLDKGEFGDISKTGKGSYTMRAVTVIDNTHNTITITNPPYTVTSKYIKDKIIDMRDDKKNQWLKDQLLDIKDLSNHNNGIKLILKLKADVNPEEFLEKLLKRDTGLEKSYPVDIRLIDDYTDYSYSIDSFLLDWIAYRRENKQASYSAKLSKSMEEQHINDILLYILKGDRALRTIKLSKDSKDDADFAKKLIAEYPEIKISSIQAKAIASMAVRDFNQDAYKRYQDKKVELIDRIAHIENVLKDVSFIDKDIIEELQDGIKRFGGPRKSKVLDMVKKKHIPKTDHIMVISKSGLCKKLPYGVDYTGKAGNTPGEPQIFVTANNRDTLLVFDSNGSVTRVAVSLIPDSDMNDVGVPLSRYCTGMGDLVDVIVEDNNTTDKSDYQIMFLTRNGFAKFTSLDEFDKLRSTRSAIKLTDGDELVYTYLVGKKKHKKDSVIIYTNKGNGVRVSIVDVPAYGIASRGLRQLSLADDEFVAGATWMPANTKLLLYATNNGKFKLTEAEYFPIMDRKSSVVNIMPLEGNESLKFITAVERNWILSIYKKSSEPVQLKVSEVPILTRVAKPKKMVNVGKGDFIAGIRFDGIE